MTVQAMRMGAALLAVVVFHGCASQGAEREVSTTALPAASRDPAGGSSAATGAPLRAFAGSTAQQSGDAEPSGAIPCATRDVVLKPTGNGGDFAGMSHSGTYLTLTNRSRNACSIPGLPQLTFLDANGPVKAEADLPGATGMHPGPVVLPLVLQPKHAVTTSARWVSGSVFQDNVCYKLTGVTLALGDGSAHAALTGQICGERGGTVRYEVQRYGAITR